MSTAACRYFESVAQRRSLPASPYVRILYAPFIADHGVTRSCGETLSAEEHARAERIKRPASRELFIQRRAFQRFCAAEATQTDFPAEKNPFRHDEKGRPFSPDQLDLRFSFAACGLGFVGAWSESVIFGIDIENPLAIDDVEKLARHFFTPREVDSVLQGSVESRHDRFCRLWCLKEAALKSVGEGLPYGLDRFEFKLQPEPRCIDAPGRWGGADMFQTHEWSEKNARAALVIRSAIEHAPDFEPQQKPGEESSFN